MANGKRANHDSDEHFDAEAARIDADAMKAIVDVTDAGIATLAPTIAALADAPRVGAAVVPDLASAVEEAAPSESFYSRDIVSGSVTIERSFEGAPAAAHPCGCCGTLLPISAEHLVVSGVAYWQCPRCGTLQTHTADIREHWTAVVADLLPGDTLTFTPPFVASRQLMQLARTPIEGEYLFERSGVVILMELLGMKLTDTAPGDRAMTYIKE